MLFEDALLALRDGRERQVVVIESRLHRALALELEVLSLHHGHLLLHELHEESAVLHHLRELLDLHEELVELGEHLLLVWGLVGELGVSSQLT